MTNLWRPRALAAALLASGLVFLSACGSSAMPQSSGGAPAAMEAAPMSTAAPAAPMADEEAGSVAPGTGGESLPQSQANQTTERLVIKTAELSLQVASVEEAEARLRAKVFELGGYVVNAQTEGSGEDMSMRVTFRVPGERFDAALSGVEGLAEKVLSRSIGGEDVTEEFVDLESQLRNLEATRSRLLDLLEKATRVEDALQVNQALTDIQGQIEAIQGRMKYLQQSAAMSTLTVYIAPVPVTPLVEEDGWQPVQVARAALRDLLAFGQGIANVAIVLAIWTPLWLPLLLLGRWGFLRLRAQLAQRPRVAVPPPAPPAPSPEA
jgi:hypothetical protein